MEKVDLFDACAVVVLMSQFAVQLQSPVCCYKGRMRRSVGGESRRFGALYTGHHLPDREASLIKKEYCRCGPHPPQVNSSRARPPLVKGAG